MSNIVSIVVIFVLAAVVCVHSRSVHTDNFKLWKTQEAATKQFKCQPRPRSFRASDMFAELKNDPNTIPSEAILHRCDSQSGCCHGKGVCTVEKAETVKLAFFSHQVGGIMIIEAENHTECSCQKEGPATIK